MDSDNDSASTYASGSAEELAAAIRKRNERHARKERKKGSSATSGDISSLQSSSAAGSAASWASSASAASAASFPSSASLASTTGFLVARPQAPGLSRANLGPCASPLESNTYTPSLTSSDGDVLVGGELPIGGEGQRGLAAARHTGGGTDVMGHVENPSSAVVRRVGRGAVPGADGPKSVHVSFPLDSPLIGISGAPTAAGADGGGSAGGPPIWNALSPSSRRGASLLPSSSHHGRAYQGLPNTRGQGRGEDQSHGGRRSARRLVDAGTGGFASYGALPALPAPVPTTPMTTHMVQPCGDGPPQRDGTPGETAMGDITGADGAPPRAKDILRDAFSMAFSTILGWSGTRQMLGICLVGLLVLGLIILVPTILGAIVRAVLSVIIGTLSSTVSAVGLLFGAAWHGISLSASVSWAWLGTSIWPTLSNASAGVGAVAAGTTGWLGGVASSAATWGMVLATPHLVRLGLKEPLELPPLKGTDTFDQDTHKAYWKGEAPEGLVLREFDGMLAAAREASYFVSLLPSLHGQTFHARLTPSTFFELSRANAEVGTALRESIAREGAAFLKLQRDMRDFPAHLCLLPPSELTRWQRWGLCGALQSPTGYSPRGVLQRRASALLEILEASLKNREEWQASTALAILKNSLRKVWERSCSFGYGMSHELRVAEARTSRCYESLAELGTGEKVNSQHTSTPDGNVISDDDSDDNSRSDLTRCQTLREGFVAFSGARAGYDLVCGLAAQDMVTMEKHHEHLRAEALWLRKKIATVKSVRQSVISGGKWLEDRTQVLRAEATLDDIAAEVPEQLLDYWVSALV